MMGWSWEDVMTSMGSGSMLPDEAGFGQVQQVRAYWEGLRSDGTLPERRDVDPRGMEHALEHVFLLERVAPGVARFRLAGQHLANLMGMEARGMPLTTVFLPAARGAAESLLEEVFATPAVLELSLEAPRDHGGMRLEGRLLLLPLMDDGLCGKALGCLVTQGEIGRRPRRFGIARQRTEALGAALRADRARTGPTPAAFAEGAASFQYTAGPTARLGVPYLRLVKSDGEM
jgi:hypothetical protein